MAGKEKPNEVNDVRVVIDDEKQEEKDLLNTSDESEESKEVNDDKKKVPQYMKPINAASEFVSENKIIILYCFYIFLALGYVIYFIAALVYGFHQAVPLILLTVIVMVIVLYEKCKRRAKPTIKKCTALKSLSSSHKQKLSKAWLILGCICVTVFFIWMLISIILNNPRQLISLVGLGLIILVCFIFSKYPNAISWRPVLWGILLQFILGLIILRTKFGYNSVRFIGDQVAAFMRYTDVGSKFVFDHYEMHLFAFKVLPMIVFFSTVMNMLYYVGLMQWFIGKLAWLTQISLGTSAIESTVAAANIFVGMTEAPLVVRPYLADLTKAEIHSVLTCGLGSIAFSVFGPFVEFGVDSVHLLTACVMSAPASLAISRLLYPERKKSKFMTTDSLALSGGTDRNIVEAAAIGASMSIGLVANIAANLIAFIALLAFINGALGWFGSFVGYPEFSFELICSYLFMPLAFLMGADWEDCGMVGELFGTKTFLNEFIAYKSMKPIIANRLNDTVPKYINGTLQFMSPRSEVVAIHALCGFCNVSSLGIIIGGLGTLMPTRKKDLAELAMRALMGGILTCCMTASIASLLYMEPQYEEILNSTSATTDTMAATPYFMNVTMSDVTNITGF